MCIRDRYNCRFGDPETQPILMRMKSDFLNLCLKAAKQELRGEQIKWDERFALGVVMASKAILKNMKLVFQSWA